MAGRLYTADDLDAWQAWYDRLDAPGPYHTPEYVDLLAGNYEDGTERPRLFVYGDEDAFVYYPYLERPIAELPFAGDALDDPEGYADIISSWYWGGPLLSPGADDALAATFVDAFSGHCADRGIVSEFLRFDPNVENALRFPGLDPQFSGETVTVDLTRSDEAIWDDYEGRNQRAIKQGRESDLEIDRDTTGQDVAAFHEIYTNAMDARDAAPHYRFALSFFEELLSTDLFTLVVARAAGEVVGGFVIAHDDRIAHHYLSASNPDYWDDRVNNLLYHEVVMYMRDTGRELFDFQGGRPGVFKFKKGFSMTGRGEFYVATRTHLPDVYDRLVDAAAEHGVDTDTDYFPGYRRQQTTV